MAKKLGRPPIFNEPEELEKVALEYFKWADSNPWVKTDAIRGGERAGELVYIPTQRPYTLIALCHHIGMNVDTWYEYEKKTGFSEITTWVREKIRNQKMEGATVGAFNSNIIARELGLRDNVNNDQNVTVTIKREKK